MPANDDFGSAVVLDSYGTPVFAKGTTVGATLEAGEPSAGSGASASVWYTWTPSWSGAVTATTAASDFDTLLAIYTGSHLASLTRIAANDDCAGVVTSCLTTTVTAGVTYAVQIDGYAGAAGDVGLTLMAAHPPTNDDVSHASVLSGPLPLHGAGYTTGATSQPGEQHPVTGSAGQTVWFTWTPPGAGLVTVSTHSTHFDTVLAVFTNEPWDSDAVLTEMTPLPHGANDDCVPQSNGDSCVTVCVAGAHYPIGIQVDGFDGDRPNGQYDLSVVAAPLPNNAFASRSTMAGDVSPSSVYGSNVGATAEAHEPGSATKSVWWTWTPTYSGRVQVCVNVRVSPHDGRCHG